LQLRPGYLPSLLNKALWLPELHRFDEAFAVYDQLRSIDPDNADAEWNASYLHLLTGDFEAGWRGREARWRSQSRRPTTYPDFAEPGWLGAEPVDGKTVLVYADEGLGDAIQFARYVPMVAARGARVILVVGDALLALMSRLPGVTQCLAKPLAAPPHFD